MSIDEMIKVLKAVWDGKEIQSRGTNSQKWETVDKERLKSAISVLNFRVKPKPQEFWIVIRPDESRGWCFPSEKAVLAHGFVPIDCVHVREVIE